MYLREKMRGAPQGRFRHVRRFTTVAPAARRVAVSGARTIFCALVVRARSTVRARVFARAQRRALTVCGLQTDQKHFLCPHCTPVSLDRCVFIKTGIIGQQEPTVYDIMCWTFFLLLSFFSFKKLLKNKKKIIKKKCSTHYVIGKCTSGIYISA